MQDELSLMNQELGDLLDLKEFAESYGSALGNILRKLEAIPQPALSDDVLMSYWNRVLQLSSTIELSDAEAIRQWNEIEPENQGTILAFAEKLNVSSIDFIGLSNFANPTEDSVQLTVLPNWKYRGAPIDPTFESEDQGDRKRVSLRNNNSLDDPLKLTHIDASEILTLVDNTVQDVIRQVLSAGIPKSISIASPQLEDSIFHPLTSNDLGADLILEPSPIYATALSWLHFRFLLSRYLSNRMVAVMKDQVRRMTARMMSIVDKIGEDIQALQFRIQDARTLIETQRLLEIATTLGAHHRKKRHYFLS